MSGRVGSITTPIIADGLILNIDAANRASTIPSTSTDKAFNTVNTAISGAFAADGVYDSSTISPSFNFDGIVDYINLNDSNSVSGLNGLTFSVWLKPTTGVAIYDGIICSRSGNDYILFHIGTVSSPNYQVYVQQQNGTGGVYTVSNVTGLTLDSWQNVTVTGKVGEKWNVYSNGVISNLTQGSNSIGGITQEANFDIGQDGSTRRYVGNIGPIHIYNRALSATEVMRNFNALKDRMGYVAPLLLDTYTGAAAAYSLRRLSNNYTGNLIRVAKKVSNVESETDIGYNSSNELDTTALAAFASGADNGDVRVVTWYDQSGNGNNITQSTFNSAPWIYDDSSLQTSNGKPAIRTAGNVWLQTSNQPLSSTQQSGFMVGEPISNGNGFMSIFGHGDYRTYFYFSTPQIGLSMVGISKAVSNVGNFAVGDQALISYYNNSSTLFFRQDGSQLGSTSVTPASYGSKDMMIGQYWTGTANGNVNKIFNGYNQEHIVFPSEQSSNISGIETNINTYYSIY